MYKPASDRYEQMPYRPAGKSGLRFPALSLGLWHNFGATAEYSNMKRMCHTAFDLGITHFDLANNYGPHPGAAEENFGRILADGLGAYRDELLISTKAGYTMWDGPYGDHGSRKYLIASLDQSLRRMGIPYVDVFYHHRMDPNTPLEETVTALADIVRAGKALYIGLSNYDGETMKRASAILRELHCPFVINQNRVSIFDRNVFKNGLISAAEEEGKGIIAFSPLEQGLLSGRYLDGIPVNSRVRTDGRFLREEHITEEKLAKVRALLAIAKERGESLAAMALAWVLSVPCMSSVICGASSPEQIRANAKMAVAAPFTEEELAAIDRIVGL